MCKYLMEFVSARAIISMTITRLGDFVGVPLVHFGSCQDTFKSQGSYQNMLNSIYL